MQIGCDIVEIARIETMLREHPQRFVERVLTHSEQQVYASKNLEKTKIAYLAKRYAAKEAIAKALGCGIGEKLSFQDMTIIAGENGRPECTLSPKAQSLLHSLQASQVRLSLSDEKAFAMATAIVY